MVNRATWARFRVRRRKRGWGAVGGGAAIVQVRWWWWCSVAFVNARWEKGLRLKNAKLNHSGSISGAPSEVGVGSSEERCSNGADEVVVVVVVVVVVRRCVCKREAGEAAEGQ